MGREGGRGSFQKAQGKGKERSDKRGLAAEEGQRHKGLSPRVPWRLELGRGLVSCLGGFACLSWKSQLKGIAEDNFGVNNLCIQSSYFKKKKKRSCLAETCEMLEPYM